MPNQKNIQIVDELKEKVAKAKSIILMDYLGLSADNINALRQEIRDEEAEMAVAKNTLLKIALKENKLEVKPLEADLKGPTAVVFSYKDAISPIKKLFEFAKRLELPNVKSAIIEGEYNDAQKVKVLSELPTREELLASVVGSLNSPLSGFVNVLGGAQRKFVYALSALAKKSGGAEGREEV